MTSLVPRGGKSRRGVSSKVLETTSPKALSRGAAEVGEWEVHVLVDVAHVDYDAGSGVVHAATGDWDHAAEDFGDMADSALDVATGGALGAVEEGYDKTVAASNLVMGVAGATHGYAPTHGQLLHHGLQAAGEWLGDEAWHLVHGSDTTDPETHQGAAE